MLKFDPGRIAIFLIPLAGLPPCESHFVVSGTSMCACAVALFVPAYEPVTVDFGLEAFGFGRLNPKSGTAVTTKPFSVAVDGLVLPPLPFHASERVNGSSVGVASPLQVPGPVVASESPIFTLLGVTPLSVLPVQVPLSFPVTVDGAVLAFFSGGSILTLPVIAHETLPVAVIVGLPALTGPDIATMPPNASAPARAESPILRNILYPPFSGVRGSPVGVPEGVWPGQRSRNPNQTSTPPVSASLCIR